MAARLTGTGVQAYSRRDAMPSGARMRLRARVGAFLTQSSANAVIWNIGALSNATVVRDYV